MVIIKNVQYVQMYNSIMVTYIDVQNSKLNGISYLKKKIMIIVIPLLLKKYYSVYRYNNIFKILI